MIPFYAVVQPSFLTIGFARESRDASRPSASDHARKVHLMVKTGFPRCDATAFEFEGDLHGEFEVPFAQGFVNEDDTAL